MIPSGRLNDYSVNTIRDVLVSSANADSTPHLTRFKPREREGLTEIDQLLEFLDNCPLLEDIDIYYAAELRALADNSSRFPPSALTHNPSTTNITLSGCSTCFHSLPPLL